jgi:hypothetical protein
VLLLRIKPRQRRRPRRQFWPTTAPGYGAITRVMGGTDGRGFYGNQALGGAISAPVVTTFPFVIPAGYALVVYQTAYNYTPSDASLLTLSGAGNALTLTPGAQRAHNAAGGNDNSVTFFHCAPLPSNCTSCTLDASSLPAGDDGRYGQMVFYIVRDPDTVNGFFTGTPVTNTQTSTTSVNPGALTLPTDNVLELFGASTRGHAADLLPVTESPDEWPDALKHAYFDDIAPGVDYPAAFQNSIIASGAVAARVNTSGSTSTPVWTFTGSSPTTGAAHSVLVAYNILGGTSGKVTKSRRTHPLGMSLGMRRVGR